VYKLTYLSLAKNDIQNIVNYYDNINPKLTEAFLIEFKHTADFIQKSPESCQEKLKNVSVSYLKRFRFGIYFKIYDKNSLVIAVLHTSRNPKIWKIR